MVKDGVGAGGGGGRWNGGGVVVRGGVEVGGRGVT